MIFPGTHYRLISLSKIPKPIDPRRSAIHSIPTLTLLKPQNSLDSSASHSTLPLPVTSIRPLHIKILAPISPDDKLTPEEKNGGIDGPVMSSLVQAWRDAFRCIPAQHHIECVTFDMKCKQPCELRHIVRLLQEVSTGMYMKTKGNTGRELVFDVMGCERQRRWLLANLPGKTGSELLDEELHAEQRLRST